MSISSCEQGLFQTFTSWISTKPLRAKNKEGGNENKFFIYSQGCTLPSRLVSECMCECMRQGWDGVGGGKCDLPDKYSLKG